MLAKKKKDIATMTRADELLGKYLAMFTDKVKSDISVATTPEEHQAISDAKNRLNLMN